MSQLIRAVIAAVVVHEGTKKRRLFPYRPSVTFFSHADIWILQARGDTKVCPICRELEDIGEFRGDHLRAAFPYLEI